MREQQTREAEETERRRRVPFGRLAPAQRLFIDGLACTFSHLDLIELLGAASVCRAWLAAALHMPSIDAKLRGICRRAANAPAELLAVPATRLRLFCASPFAKHVTALEDAETCAYGETCAWPLADLQMLQRLPCLRTLVCAVRLQPGDDAPCPFPPRLESVAIRTDNGLLAPVLRSLASAASLQRLTIRGPKEEHPHWNLSSLLELSQLAEVKLEAHRAVLATAAPIVKQRGSLRELRLTVHSSADYPLLTWLRPLCAAPHQLLALENLALDRAVLLSRHLELLSELPALTRFQPSRVSIQAMPLLQRFRFLRTATVWLRAASALSTQTGMRPSMRLAASMR